MPGLNWADWILSSENVKLKKQAIGLIDYRVEVEFTRMAIWSSSEKVENSSGVGQECPGEALT